MQQQHGGPRKNSGRKKGSGTRKRAEKILNIQHASGEEMPLEYMLRIMRDPEVEDKRRDAMALAASAHCHPTLKAIEVSGSPDRPLETVHTIRLVAPAVSALIEHDDS